jgi:branched-chain amino acid transport system ATP-binding protein
MAELGRRIREFTAETSVLLVEHHMDLVMAVCDRVVVLDFGRRLAEGEPADIQVDPRVLDAYLGVEVDAAH